MQGGMSGWQSLVQFLKLLQAQCAQCSENLKKIITFSGFKKMPIISS